ncbi:MAG: glycine--tRNA ligase subunit beta [bacterium]
MNSFLLEIGLEEVPASMIQPSIEQLRELVAKTLQQQNLSGQIEIFGTPRRFGLLVRNLPASQANRIEEIKGPPVEMAKDEKGHWKQAALGFAKKNGIDPEKLEVRDFSGKEYLYAIKHLEGKTTKEILETSIVEWIQALRFPKNMRWGSYRQRFVRPIRWLTCLWNSEVVSVELEMVRSGNRSFGHRFLSKESFTIDQADEYENKLRDQWVIASTSKRRERIEEQIQELERKYKWRVEIDPALLMEVTNLVEWPTALVGSFEEAFLELPNEVLVTSMAVHQRYFPVYEKDGTNLLPYFITIRNGNEHGLDTVRLGNERVIRARLSDARFFYQEDQKGALEDFEKKAANAIFFPERGSQQDRTERIQLITERFSNGLLLDQKGQEEAKRIAKLCKFDLQTQMVYEFPELQGIMGERYAKILGESERVCRGIREHYLPGNAEDHLPQDPITWPVALADRIDSLSVAFSLGKIPTGAADPFALRRAAQGILQLILGLKLPLSLNYLIDQSLGVLKDQQSLELDWSTIHEQLLEFLQQRQRYLLQDQYGFQPDLILALEKGSLVPASQLELGEQLRREFKNEALKKALDALQRPLNIWAKNSDTNLNAVNSENFRDDAEKELWDAAQQLTNDSQGSSDFVNGAISLESKIERFFENVMVMDEDPSIRSNRLNICKQIHDWSLQYLDLRELHIQK